MRGHGRARCTFDTVDHHLPDEMRTGVQRDHIMLMQRRVTDAPWRIVQLEAQAHRPRCGDAHLRGVGERTRWGLGPRVHDADDQAVAQAWLALYACTPDPAMLQLLRKRYDMQMHSSDDPRRPLWWRWCDALFMTPPVWAGLTAATHDPACLDYMNRQWWVTSALLYDPTEHL